MPIFRTFYKGTDVILTGKRIMQVRKVLWITYLCPLVQIEYADGTRRWKVADQMEWDFCQPKAKPSAEAT